MVHVIKISGYELDQPAAFQLLVQALQGLVGRVVLVHGGGSILPRALRNMQRNSDALSVAAMALRGGVNPQLVAALGEQHIQAIGLSGVDLELMYIQQRDNPPIVRFEVLHYLLAQSWLPVLAPIALDVTTGRGVVLNADRAAQMIASALGAEELTFLVNTPGVYSGSKRVAGISARQSELYVRQGVIDQAYASVVQAAADAAAYVGRVRITDAGSLSNGAGTLVLA